MDRVQGSKFKGSIRFRDSNNELFGLQVFLLATCHFHLGSLVNTKILARQSRNQFSEYLSQRREGAKGLRIKLFSELGALGVLAR
jgi:hypothetical protein